jgi:hypothetical protein
VSWLKCISNNFPTPAGSNCPLFLSIDAPIADIYNQNKKNGQFELAGVGVSYLQSIIPTFFSETSIIPSKASKVL